MILGLVALIIAGAAFAVASFALFAVSENQRLNAEAAKALARHLHEHRKHEYRIPTNGKAADHA